MNISASSYIAFRQCPRMYYYKHVIRLERAREEGARRFGTLYHAGLEEWWKAAGDRTPWSDKDEPLMLALKGIAENARHIRTDEYDVVAAEAMMIGYHARYFELEFESAYADGRSGVEQYFKVPLLDPDGNTVDDWFVTGKKDAIKRFPAGTKIVEHKTTTSEINAGSDYWLRLGLDTQSSIYIDAARVEGHQVNEVMYDVSRRPGIEPKKATPIEKRKFTKGKGCTDCGGRAGGKLGTAQGTGQINVIVEEAGKKIERLVKCNACLGSGWRPGDEPKLHKNHRVEDEPYADYKLRVAEEIVEDPDAHFRMGVVKRDMASLDEARADLVVTTGEITTLMNWSQSEAVPNGGDLRAVRPRRCWPRNTNACTTIYGRRCDYLDVCSGAVQPYDSPLYVIRPRALSKDAEPLVDAP